jgi:hypothetical protein
MDMPGTVLAAKIIGWLQVAYVVVIGAAALVFSADLGGEIGRDIGFVAFMLYVLVGSYFAIPLLFLQPGRPAGRSVVIILQSLAGLIFFSWMIDSGSAGFLPFCASCLTVAGVLCTPSASRWSAPGRRTYVVAPAPPMSYGPATFAREQGAAPFAFQQSASAFPAAPAHQPTAPPTTWAPTAPMLDENGAPIPPPPPVIPPGYRWEPPSYRR